MNLAARIKNSRWLFWSLLGTLLLMIMVRYAFQTDVPRVLFLAIISLVAFCGDRSQIVALCMCFIPMHESIDFYYALVICIAVYMFKYLKSVRFGYNLLIVLAIAVWELLHCFSTSFDIVKFLVYIVPFIVLAVLIASDVKELDYPFIVRAFAYSTLGITLILFIRVLFFADFNFALALSQLQRMGSDLHSGIEEVAVSGGQINPNSLGIIAVLASTGLMQLRSVNKSKKSDMIVMCATLALAALGTSRTYLACLVLMVILLVFSEKGTIVNKLRLILVLFLVIAVAVVAMAILFPETFAFYITRFLTEDITTGRDDLFKNYHYFIENNPKVMFFGVGLQDFGDRLINYYRVANNGPHNFVQEIVVAWGIPGLLLLAIQFFSMYWSSRKANAKITLLNWIPLIIIIFKSLAGQLLTSSYTMLALAFAYLSLCQGFNSTNSSEQSRL